MVKVHNNLHGGNLLYCSQDGRAVGTHHLNYITHINVSRVELTVDGKHLTVKVLNVVGIILAVSVGKGDCKVEGVALLQILQGILKSIEGVSHAAQELKGLFTGCLFNLFTLTITVRHQCICHTYLFVCNILHNYFLYCVNKSGLKFLI